MKINGATFLQAVKRCLQYTGATLANIRVAKNKMLVSSSNEGRTFAELIDVETNDSWKATIRLESGIGKLLKGQIDMTSDGATLVIKSSAYKGEFQTEPYTSPEFTDTKMTQVSAEMSQALSRALDYSALSAFMQTSVMCEFASTPKYFQLAIWDNLHFAYWKFKAVAGGLHGKFTLDHVSTLLGAVGGDEFSLSFANNFIYAKNATTKFSMPSMAQDTDEGLADLVKLTDTFQAPICKLYLADLSTALQNASAICGTGEAVTLEFNKNRLLISIESDTSKFQEAVAIEELSKSTKFNVDPALLLDILIRFPADTQIVVGVAAKILWVRQKLENAAVICGCLMSQDQG